MCSTYPRAVCGVRESDHHLGLLPTPAQTLGGSTTLRLPGCRERIRGCMHQLSYKELTVIGLIDSYLGIDLQLDISHIVIAVAFGRYWATMPR